MVESLGSWWRSLTHRNDDDEHDADDDTLDDATNALLSMLPLASIVVDEHDEVIRAHPSAYSLGVVRDDVIIGRQCASARYAKCAPSVAKSSSI
ncbi:MAG: hypothetical protein ACLUPW_08340 [Bifidobacterium pseudocatenulatum]